MSIEAAAWALNVPIGGNAKVILVGLGSHADADFEEARPSVETLARYAHCDRRTVQRHLRALEADGWIEQTGTHALKGRRDRSVAVYRLTGRSSAAPSHGATSVVERGGTDDAHGATVVPPEPSIGNVQELSGSLERAGAAVKKVTYNGKVVPSLIVRGAEELLRNFNEATGRSLGGRTADGGASPALRQIIGAMLARPQVRPDSWAEGIRRTVENPPAWMAGQTVQIGHVFGERAAEWALSNNGKVAERAAKDPAKQQRVDRFMDVLQRYAA